jgi:tetratricopeptide (TPR) repeat protein
MSAPLALANTTSVVEADRERATGYYEKGMVAFRAGRYREAINAFREADRIAPSPALSFDVALAHEQLGEVARALEHYREYLRRAPDASERARIEERISDLRGKLVELGLQQVTVESSPPGANLSIDGLPLGRTPWTGELHLGAHELVASQAGHETRKLAFQLSPAAAADIEVVLTKKNLPANPAPPAPPPPVAIADEPRGAAEIDAEPFRWSFIALGTGAASLVGAGVFEVLRQKEEEAAESARYQLEYEEAYERHQSRQWTSRVLLGAGGALVLTGGILLWFESRPEESPTASLACGVTGCMGTLGRSF